MYFSFLKEPMMLRSTRRVDGLVGPLKKAAMLSRITVNRFARGRRSVGVVKDLRSQLEPAGLQKRSCVIH